MNRRQLLKVAPLAAVGVGFGLVHELVKPDREPLSHVRGGDILTAESWNALVARVNLLGEAS